MSGKVIKFHPDVPADNPDNVLEGAKGEYTAVVLFGYTHDGGMETRGSTNLTLEETLWIIKSFEHKLLNGDYSE